LELKKQHLAILTMGMVIVLAAALANYWLLLDSEHNIQFPTGIPYAFGGITSPTSIGDAELQNTIFVSGLGSASAQANKATITLGVQTQHASASEAVSMNAESMTDVIDALKEIGITEDEMKTVSYSVNPVYNRDGWDTVTGYRVVNMIQVEIKDINKVGPVIDTAASSGANRIYGITFGLTDDEIVRLELEAFEAALNHASNKAETIADHLGVTITGVLSVSESSYNPYTPYRSYDLAYEGASTPIIEGSLSVSVTVQVAYSFE